MAQQRVTTSEITKSYTSFSGADIIASFTPPNGKPVVIGELQGITYSITREKAPIYTMGSANPRSFSRGKRGIAGSLVFTVFDRDALIMSMKDSKYTTAKGNVGFASIDKWGDKISVDSVTGEVTVETTEVTYTDQLPPFDITVNFVNEYGQAAVMRILAVEILNEGIGMSVDDITTDKACTFVARDVVYVTPM